MRSVFKSNPEPLTKYLLLFSLFFLQTFQSAFAQCSIVSDSVVCLDDFIGFKVVLNTGTASSYSWDMDDSKTSTLPTPLAQYSSFGLKQIKVTVQLQGGGSCSANRTIYVHDRPVAKFQLSSLSNLCFSQNNVCYTDLSSPGQTGSPVAKRVVLFGDGSADVNLNPTANSKVCYSYPGSGYFSLVMEVTDTKGCYSRDYDTVNVFKDIPALYGYDLVGDCDSSYLCMHNLTKMDSSDSYGHYWIFGDGTVDSVNWSHACHVYRDSGSFTPMLVVRSGPNCVDTFRQNGLIKLNPIKFDVQQPIREGCLNTQFPFEDLRKDKDDYSWFYSEQGSIFYAFDNGTSAVFNGNKISSFAIKLVAERGTCRKTYFLDTIRVNGPLAGINARNASICMQGDTTYFCDNSIYKNTYGVKRLWKFNDFRAPACTTNTAKGINVGMNCNFSEDRNPKHYYSYDTCYTARLDLVDTVTGCLDSAFRNVLIGKEDTATLNLRYVNARACTGNDDSRKFYFLVDGCGEYLINPDSASGAGFIKNLPYWYFDSMPNPSGYVTVGLVTLGGDSNNTCPGITSGPMCTDTFWYHNFIHVIPEPIALFEPVRVSGCSPFEAEFKIADSLDTYLRKLYWFWGDGTMDSVIYQEGDTVKSSYFHTYTKNGLYKVELVVENVRACAQHHDLQISVGHFSQGKSIGNLCKGSCLQFYDSTFYYGDSNYYWKDPYRRVKGFETIRWEWGDGTFDTTHNPRKCFDQVGIYDVKLITMDSVHCADTQYMPVAIGGIEANMIAPKSVILCSEIVQTFDSSIFLNPSIGETIVEYTWLFGDGSRPKKIKDPYHFYSSFGFFDVTLIAKSSLGCIDTATSQVEVIGPLPSFEFVTDTIGCAPFTVEMKNTSSRCVNWIWYFGDLNNTTYPTQFDSNARFTYQTPGTYYLYLYGADSIYNPATNNRQFCSATFPDIAIPGQIEKKVIVLPNPKAGFIVPDTVCVNTPFVAIQNSDKMYTDHNWDFGNGNIQSTKASAVSNVYNKKGTFTVTYTPTFPPDPISGKACYDTITKDVEVIGIEADFEVDTMKSGPLDFKMINKSKGGVEYDWSFISLDSNFIETSKEVHPYHRFYPNQGRFDICLIATNSEGCKDTTCKTYTLTYEPRIFIPNVFTPGVKDGINDAFDIDIDGEKSYHARIFNRWGELVYESHEDGFGDDGINWRGTLPDNSILAAGVYYLVFDYEFYYKKPVRYKGTITIIR